MNSAPCKKVLAPDAWALGTARQRRQQLVALERTAYPKAARDLLPLITPSSEDAA